MRDESRPRHRLVALLAERQYGAVAHRQLIGLGLSRAAIGRWVSKGWLHPLYKGVYAVGHPVIAIRGQWMAAVLACGPTAVLSHRDAAHLWDIRSGSRRHIDVTVPGRSRRGRDGITLHLVRRLADEERGWIDRIPVTSLARTLLDLAEVVPARELERAFEEADRRRILRLRDVAAAIERNPGRRGTKPLAALVERRWAPPPVRSDFERDFLDLCREAGYRVLRVTWRRLKREPDEVAAAVRAFVIAR